MNAPAPESPGHWQARPPFSDWRMIAPEHLEDYRAKGWEVRRSTDSAQAQTGCDDLVKYCSFPDCNCDRKTIDPFKCAAGLSDPPNEAPATAQTGQHPIDLTNEVVDAALSEYWDLSPRGWNEAQRIAMRKAILAALGVSLASAQCTCGADDTDPIDHHDISCPVAISSAPVERKCTYPKCDCGDGLQVCPEAKQNV